MPRTCPAHATPDSSHRSHRHHSAGSLRDRLGERLSDTFQTLQFSELVAAATPIWGEICGEIWDETSRASASFSSLLDEVRGSREGACELGSEAVAPGAQPSRGGAPTGAPHSSPGSSWRFDSAVAIGAPCAALRERAAAATGASSGSAAASAHSAEGVGHSAGGAGQSAALGLIEDILEGGLSSKPSSESGGPDGVTILAVSAFVQLMTLVGPLSLTGALLLISGPLLCATDLALPQLGLGIADSLHHLFAALALQLESLGAATAAATGAPARVAHLADLVESLGLSPTEVARVSAELGSSGASAFGEALAFGTAATERLHASAMGGPSALPTALPAHTVERLREVWSLHASELGRLSDASRAALPERALAAWMFAEASFFAACHAYAAACSASPASHPLSPELRRTLWRRILADPSLPPDAFVAGWHHRGAVGAYRTRGRVAFDELSHGDVHYWLSRQLFCKQPEHLSALEQIELGEMITGDSTNHSSPPSS